MCKSVFVVSVEKWAMLKNNYTMQNINFDKIKFENDIFYIFFLNILVFKIGNMFKLHSTIYVLCITYFTVNVGNYILLRYM